MSEDERAGLIAETTPRGVLSRSSRNRSVPLIVDDVRKGPNFSIVRCSFFTIETDMPSSDWRMTLGNHRISFYLLGLSGVIWRPMRGIIFGKPSQIDELFELIERDPILSVGVNDIWFPFSLFNECVRRGDVYRVSEELFKMGYLFRRDRVSKEEFFDYCERSRHDLRESTKETESFRRWSSMQIERAKESYPKNRELALKWREDVPYRSERGRDQY